MQLLSNGLPTGIGTDEERTQATAWMRQQPWYQNMLKAWGIPPTQDDVKLNDEQRQAILIAAQKNGIAIPDGQQINENGQIAKDPSHLWRNIAIGAAIGGLALTGLGAAGIGPFAGAFGAGGAAADAGVAAADGGFGVGGLTAGSIGIGELTPEAIALGAPGAVAGTGLGAGTAALSTGSKLAGLAKGLSSFGGNTPGTEGGGLGTSPRANAAAGAAAQLAANRAAQAKIDQGGPAADKTAMQNLFRSAIVSRMDPNAAPITMNGIALPKLANADLVSQAGTYNKQLSDRLAAGKTPTDFGIADPTQQETDLNNKALDASGLNGGVNGALGDLSDYLSTGSRMANFGSNAYNLGKSIYNIWS
jgi:hypothetical protein